MWNFDQYGLNTNLEYWIESSLSTVIEIEIAAAVNAVFLLKTHGLYTTFMANNKCIIHNRPFSYKAEVQK